MRRADHTCDGKWFGEARVDPAHVGPHCSSEAARAQLCRVLRSLADVVERDG